MLIAIGHEKRREVAAKLRKCGAELSIIGADCETACHVIDNVIGCQEEDSWEMFFYRLADLIDPTCHIVLRQSDSDITDEPHYLCSRCGKEAVYVYERRDYTLAGIVSHARYCSYCGARVVD